jgi:hypothetical protein
MPQSAQKFGLKSLDADPQGTRIHVNAVAKIQTRRTDKETSSIWETISAISQSNNKIPRHVKDVSEVLE